MREFRHLMKRTTSDVVSMDWYGNGERTESSTGAVLETFPEIVNLDSWLTAVPPNHPAGLSETFLVIGENDEVVKGGYGISPWHKFGKIRS